jgi:hypothetical protein
MPRLAWVNPMIYRILVYHPGGVWRLLAELPTGLQALNIWNRRARFYFTKRGWQKTGRVVAAEARQRGNVVKVTRRKQPGRSQIVYRDDLQVAILPARAERE